MHALFAWSRPSFVFFFFLTNKSGQNCPFKDFMSQPPPSGLLFSAVTRVRVIGWYNCGRHPGRTRTSMTRIPIFHFKKKLIFICVASLQEAPQIAEYHVSQGPEDYGSWYLHHVQELAGASEQAVQAPLTVPKCLLPQVTLESEPDGFIQGFQARFPDKEIAAKEEEGANRWKSAEQVESGAEKPVAARRWPDPKYHSWRVSSQLRSYLAVALQ